MEIKGNGTLISHLDIIARDKAFIAKALSDKLSRTEQIQRIRNLLTPPELERYDAGMALITSLKDIQVPVPDKMYLTDIKNMPEDSAAPVEAWLKENAKQIRVYGGFVDWLYTKVHRPSDIDIAVTRPKLATEELAKLIKGTSGKDVRVEKYKRIPDSYKIFVGNQIAVDLHPISVYAKKMPYHWDLKPAVMVFGVPTEALGEQLMKRGEQLLNPGIGIEGRGMIGPRAAQRSWREKDIPRMEAVASLLIHEADKQGKVKLAAEANNNLRILMRSPVKPYPQIIPSTVEAIKQRIRKVRKVKAGVSTASRVR